MERRLRLASFGALALLQAIAACEVVFPTRLESLTADASPSTPDASAPDSRASDATLEHDASSPDTGPSCGISPPPNTSTVTPFGSDSIIAAIKTVYYRQDAGPIPDLGFDLDCVDTCPGPGSCKPRSASQKNCDLSGGRDVAANFFIETFENFQQVTASESVDQRIAEGKIGFFVWVSSYNGQPNDPEVVLATLGATGTVDVADGGPRSIPNWDGNDVWYVDPTSAGVVVENGTSKYLPNVLSSQAYVTDSTLVGSLSNLPLDVFGTSVVLSSATVVAQITAVPGVGYRLDGQLAGRVSIQSLLRFASTLHDPLDGTKYLCGDDQTFLTLLPNFCNAADIMANPMLDSKPGNGNPLLECDGMSLSIGFSAISAKLGPERSSDPLVFGCDGSVAECP